MASLRLLQAALFANSYFYASPWKLALHRVVGGDYATGYTHFRRDHVSWLNLLAHQACLVAQAGGNFAVLHALDKYMGWTGVVSLRGVTCVAWSALQGTATAPPLARMLAVTVIAASALMAPALNAAGVEAFFVSSFALVFVLASSLGIRGKQGRLVNWRTWLPNIVGVYGGLEVLWRVLARVLHRWHPAAPMPAAMVLVALQLLLAAVSAKPTVPSVLFGLVGSRVAHLLTGVEAFHFYSLGFLGQGFQGLSHKLSGEPATILQLESGTDKAKALEYEFAHACYFPTLLMHACVASWSRAPAADALVYRIALRHDWEAALAGNGRYVCGELDRKSGFVHLSSAAQVEGTLNAFFKDQDVVIAQYRESDLGRLGVLKWEPVPSRGNELFAHLYGTLELPCAMAVRVEMSMTRFE